MIIVAAAATALAKPHGHAHRHGIAKRGSPVVYAPGPVETVIVYELDGHSISEDDVRKGIANGTLTWGEDGNLSSSIPVVSLVAIPAPTANANAAQPDQPEQEPDVAQPEPEHESPSQSPSFPGSYEPLDKDGNCPDCDKEFPNRHFDCGSFPTGFGAIHVGNEGLGGWSGIQAPAKRDVAGFHDIMTVPTGSCPDGNCCTPGRFCSYACPNPYLKMSFPKMQGARKESVGGLFCNQNGKLEMADGSIAKTLCGIGSTRMRVFVQSKLSKPVSICRTDYPGLQSESFQRTLINRLQARNLRPFPLLFTPARPRSSPIPTRASTSSGTRSPLRPNTISTIRVSTRPRRAPGAMDRETRATALLSISERPSMTST